MRVVFADAEEVVRAHLATVLTGVAAYAPPLPPNPSVPSVFIQRTGGTTIDRVVDVAQITVECRAATPKTAATLAELVRSHLLAVADAGHMGGRPVYTARSLSAPYLDPDPVHPTVARYSATYLFNIRGDIAA